MILPLVVAASLLVVDQVSKAIIVWVSQNQFPTVLVSILWDFLQIRHDRNLGIAFSGFNDLEGWARWLFLILIPLAFLGWIAWIYLKDPKIDQVQRWGLALILSGGIGNLIDRIFRPEGVVDFISVKLYGLLGMERWPTFNVADATLVVGGGLILLGYLLNRPAGSRPKGES